MTEINLTKDPIYRLIRQLSIPASTGLLFNTLYNVVDTYFAGQQIGTDALAGITVGFPIFFVLIAISTGIGNGTVALSSIALGEEDSHKYHTLGKNALLIGLLFSLLLMTLGNMAVSPLLEISGAEGTSLSYGASYLQIIFLGSIFVIINGVLNALLVSSGDTKSFRNFLIFGFFLNCLLDPLFIMGWFHMPKLGVAGIALATAMIQAFGTLYLVYRLHRKDIFHWHLMKEVKITLASMRDILVQGIPSMINTATIALGVFVINYFILKTAPGPVTIGAFGAGMRVEQLALIPTMGLNTAAITIVGQNFGAKNFRRIYETKRKSLLVGLSIIVVGTLLIYPFVPWLIGIFDSSPEVIAAGTTYLRIELFALPTYIILGLYISVLQGIKKPNWAVIIGIYRQILMPFILFTLFTKSLNMGIEGVWLAIVLINWSAVLFTVIYSHHALKNTLK